MKIDLSLSKNQARDSARLEAEFLTNISHEIRMPLNAVIGMTSLALDEDISSKARECVINARTSAITLLNVLDDIIDFSMMEADGLKLNMNRFDFYLWFEGLIVSHSMSARQKGLEFQYVIDEGVPRWMVSDALRLSKIVDTILINAINFTKNGFIEIKVLIDHKTISENQSKNFNLNFLITDTGCGMSPDAVEKPFEPLSRVDCPTSRVAGRGLIICQRLVAAFNGHISLTSELGVGTEFSIGIPVEVLDTQDNSISQVKNRENNVQALTDLSSLNGMKVLLVEDHPFNRQMMMVMLGKMGLVVDVAVNGSEALTKLNSMPSYYDVILMDIQMPVMDGITTTREIREQAIFNDLPIIAVTANAMSDEKDACIRAGVQAYLVKPVNPSVLQDVLLSLAGRRKIV